MIGVGVRFNGVDVFSFLLLYDFEELEGELDFFIRVVVFIFYFGVLGRILLIFGEVYNYFFFRF